MLLVLAASAVRQRLARASARATARTGADGARRPTATSEPCARDFRSVADSPHLRHLAALVLLGTTGAALVEYLFKARAVRDVRPRRSSAAFFRALLRRNQPRHASPPDAPEPGRCSSGSAWGCRRARRRSRCSPAASPRLLAPGFGSVLVARAGESIFRGSWFRSWYELFYTPIPAAEKRAAKSVIDVALRSTGRCGRRRAGAARRAAHAALFVVHHSLARDRRVGGRHRRRQPAESLVHPHARKQPGQPGRRHRRVAYRRRRDRGWYLRRIRHDADRGGGAMSAPARR